MPREQESWRQPGWSESYTDSSVIVAYAANLDSISGLSAKEELLCVHTISTKLDSVLTPQRDIVWKVQSLFLPYYCALCPADSTHDHADMLIEVAMGLHNAASQVSTVVL